MAARKKPVKPPEPDSVFRFELDGKPYEIDAEALTFGEIEDLELYFDCSYEMVDLESGRGLMFMAFLARKRSEPRTTLDDVRRLPISALTEAKPTVRPTEEGAGSGTPS